MRYLLVSLAALLLTSGCRPQRPPQVKTSVTKPPAQVEPEVEFVSRFRNTAADVQYVGTSNCIQCHAVQHESYVKSTHYHSLLLATPQSEPAPDRFEHPPSQRNYTVLHDGNQVIHREQLFNSSSLANTHAVSYVIGSGQHARSYLIEQDGFLIQSPITWYHDQNQYAMSPDYDGAAHPGFERVVEVGCVYCHAGQVNAQNGNRFKPKIHQQSIGCESCHGPGQLHAETASRVAKIQPVEPGKTSTEEDNTIVNPARLDRQLSEAVCAQCHLRGLVTVTLTGKEVTDFRPGMPLQSCRVDYVLKSATNEMDVVGHVEQLHLSRCYTQSSTLTCTTCHDPHSSAKPEQVALKQRQICIQCHQQECTLPESQRLEVSPDDNCTQCHMPPSPTHKPHRAFTHHRIGIHARGLAKNDASSDSVGELVPIYDVASLSKNQQTRALGLAYLEVAEAQTLPFVREAYNARAEELLHQANNSPARDGEVVSGMARLAWQRGELLSAMRVAVEALKFPNNNAPTRANSLFVIADSRFRGGDVEGARSSFDQLVEIRRVPQDWALLSMCYGRQENWEKAIECLKKASSLSPFRADLHETLAELYQRAYDPEAAQRERELAKQCR